MWQESWRLANWTKTITPDRSDLQPPRSNNKFKLTHYQINMRADGFSSPSKSSSGNAGLAPHGVTFPHSETTPFIGPYPVQRRITSDLPVIRPQTREFGVLHETQ